ncbi:hypothetical protein C5C95_06250 [Rathayibacter sp. AY1B7]|uniref:hypothetical protein n=1 Tax=Rathayibacter sp. AY1B7 TaxID=2080532 RepID=UPI000CE72EF1|nr:hypothetical protein [Rathayibacter sp. AY1B7]PPH99741.1 hypothetical protein C5C95_06250 [Rathayibacter sp. AY1B7]
MVTTIPAMPAKGSTDSTAIYQYTSAVDSAVRELAAAGVPSALVGYLRADDPQWNLTPYSSSNPVTNDFTALINAAHTQRKRIVIDHRYLVGDSSLKSNWNDKHLNLAGCGELIGQGSTIVRQEVSPSPEVSLTSFKRMVVGASDEKHTVSFAAVAMNQLAKFKADMVWQIVAKPARSSTSDYTSGFYTWSLPGTVVNNLLSTKNDAYPTGDPATGKVVMADALEVLGVSFLVSGAASDLAEDNSLKGATSGATMKIESCQPDYNGSANKRIITRQVFGTFQKDENLLRGSTVVGKVAADGVVVFKTATRYDWDKVTATRVLRKLGGSINGYTASTGYPVGDYFSNLDSRIDGISFTTVNDPDSTGQVRAAAVSVSGAVHHRYSNIVFKRGYRNGFRLASPYGGMISGCQVQSLPNDAIQSEGAYGYGVEYEGTAKNCLLIGCQFANLRHGITTNPSANSQFLSDVSDTLRHGIQEFLFIKDCQSFDTYAQGFDTHHGASDVFFIGCVVNGVVAGGQKDSGKTGMGTRSESTTYIDCHVFGATNGFNDPTAGTTAASGNPKPSGTTWPLTPTHSRTLYVNCSANGYEQSGFRQGLAAESIHHSVMYVGCSADDGGQTAYDTIGWELTGVDTYIIDPRPGRNKLAMFSIEPGGYYGPTPSSPVKHTIAFVGDIFADFSRNTSTTTDLIRVKGHTTAGVTRLAIAVDAAVMQKAGAGTMPAAMVNVVGGHVTIASAAGAQVVNLNGTDQIPTVKKTSGTVVAASLPTSKWS